MSDLRKAAEMVAQPEQDPVVPPDVSNVVLTAVLAEREACAEIAENWRCNGVPRTGVAQEIRRRGEQMIRDRMQEEIDELPKQPEQEPIGWMTPSGEGFRFRFEPPTNDVPLGWTPLYTAPPNREWVGLTDGEREEATGWSVDHIEAFLKEKNT